MTAIRMRVRRSGPLFDRDPVRVFGDNVHALMADVAQDVAGDVRSRLAAGAAGRAEVSRLGGRVAERVVGRARSRAGRPWRDHFVVSTFADLTLSIDEAIALGAAASELERETGAFGRANARIHSVDLTKGIA